MHPRHVEALVRVRHDVPKSRRALESGRQLSVEVSGIGKPAERVGVRARRPEVEVQAGGHGEVDHDLHSLPEVQDDGVGGVGRRSEGRGVARQPVGDAGDVPVNGRRFLGEHFPVEGAQRESSASRSS